MLLTSTPEDILFRLSPQPLLKQPMNNELYSLVISYLKTQLNMTNIHSWMEVKPLPSIPILQECWVHDWVIMNGRRFTASERAASVSNALAQIDVQSSGVHWICEIQKIFVLEQPTLAPISLAQV